VRGGALPTVQALATSNQSDLTLRSAYVKTITSREKSALDDLHGAKEELGAKQSALAAARKSARAALGAVDAQRRAAEAAQASQQRLLDQVQGELASLVAADRQRREAEAAQRAQAELAARLAAPQPASRARTSSSGGGRSLAPSGPEPPVSKDANGAVEEARRQLGKPYRYGGSGPDSFDCSGLTAWAWGHAGHSLPHSAAAQYNATTRVAVGNIQPGDLVFFGSDIHHVGIYVGGGQMIEASHSGTPVRYASIYRSDLMGVGRVG
jgi:cell wall-associated NlpC family hydrolase